MGQNFDKLKFSCMDCSSNFPTQDDNFSEISMRAKISNNEYISQKLFDEIVAIDNPTGFLDYSHTQASLLNNVSSSKESEGMNYSFTRKVIQDDYRISKPRSKTNIMADKNESNLRTCQAKYRNSSNQLKYKTRSSNYSCISVNLVNAVRKNDEKMWNKQWKKRKNIV